MAEYKSIKEISEQLELSVQAVYHRLKSVDEEFKKLHTIRKNNKLLLDDELVQRLILNDDLNKDFKQEQQSQAESDFKKDNSFNDNVLNNEYLAQLKNQIDKLEQQIEDLKQDKLDLKKDKEVLTALIGNMIEDKKKSNNNDIVDDTVPTDAPTENNYKPEEPKEQPPIKKSFFEKFLKNK